MSAQDISIRANYLLRTLLQATVGAFEVGGVIKNKTPIKHCRVHLQFDYTPASSTDCFPKIRDSSQTSLPENGK